MGWRLFHHDLLDADLRTAGQAQEVDALFNAVHIDLAVALSDALGHRLAHAVDKLIAELGVAAVDEQRVADGVGIDAELSFSLADAVHKVDDDASGG